MLRITKGILTDNLADFKASDDFGLRVYPNNKPGQIYNAYSAGGNIIFFYAYLIGYRGKIEATYELSIDSIIYQDGQYLIDPTKYFDNVDNNNVLPDGNYMLSFSNGVEDPFNSEVFLVFQAQLDGAYAYNQPEIKHFEDSQIFIFNN